MTFVWAVRKLLAAASIWVRRRSEAAASPWGQAVAINRHTAAKALLALLLALLLAVCTAFVKLDLTFTVTPFTNSQPLFFFCPYFVALQMSGGIFDGF